MVSSPRFQDSDFDDQSRRTQSSSSTAATGPEAVERLLTLWQEVAAYAAHYLAARVDAGKSRLRRIALVVGMLLAVALGVCIILATSAVLLVIGAAQGAAVLVGGQTWVGNLFIGGGLLLVGAAAAGGVICWINRTATTATVKKYEQRKRDQRQRFGRDASGEATAGPTA